MHTRIAGTRDFSTTCDLLQSARDLLGSLSSINLFSSLGILEMLREQTSRRRSGRGVFGNPFAVLRRQWSECKQADPMEEESLDAIKEAASTTKRATLLSSFSPSVDPFLTVLTCLSLFRFDLPAELSHEFP